MYQTKYLVKRTGKLLPSAVVKGLVRAVNLSSPAGLMGVIKWSAPIYVVQNPPGSDWSNPDTHVSSLITRHIRGDECQIGVVRNFGGEVVELTRTPQGVRGEYVTLQFERDSDGNMNLPLNPEFEKPLTISTVVNLIKDLASKGLYPGYPYSGGFMPFKPPAPEAVLTEGQYRHTLTRNIEVTGVTSKEAAERLSLIKTTDEYVAADSENVGLNFRTGELYIKSGFKRVPISTPTLDKLIKYLGHAQAAAALSKDPSTKVGAVAIDDHFAVVAEGRNGFPRGVHDCPAKLNDRPTKYAHTVHAEANLVAYAARRGVSLANTHVLITELLPCSSCAGLLIQAGVSSVLAPEEVANSRWDDSSSVAVGMLLEAGVDVITYKQVEGGFEFFTLVLE